VNQNPNNVTKLVEQPLLLMLNSPEQFAVVAGEYHTRSIAWVSCS